MIGLHYFSTRYTHTNKMRDDICSHKAVDLAFPAIEPTTVRDTGVSHSGEKIHLLGCDIYLAYSFFRLGRLRITVLHCLYF